MLLFHRHALDDEKCEQAYVDVHIIPSAPDAGAEKAHAKSIVYGVQHEYAHESGDQQNVDSFAPLDSSAAQDDVFDQELGHACHHENLKGCECSTENWESSQKE